MINQTDIAAGWSPERLQLLRAELRRRDLDGLLVPRWDVHQGEYVLPRDERLAWISGFTGSWGLALVTLDAAILFVDGRYTVQAREQASPEHFQFQHLYDQPVEHWILSNGRPGQRHAYDPLVLSPSLFDCLAEACAQVAVQLVACADNPIDCVWRDRPEASPGTIHPFPVERAGERSIDKRMRLAARLRTDRVHLLVETQPDNIAWLLNVRGDDVSYTPVTHAMAVIHDNGDLDLCIDERKLVEERTRYELDGVRIHGPEQMLDVLGKRVQPRTRVSIDPKFAPVGAAAVTRARGGQAVIQVNPLTRLKAVKNEVELAGLRAASQRDSIAWIRFLAWLDRTVPERDGTSAVTEYEAEAVILAYRMELPDFVYPSFRTISAADANAAMCHYAAPATGSAPITNRSIYLIDSGGQYFDGTTDTTRTVCFAPPPADVRRNFTLVLKGHARLATARFPPGTYGHQIDAFAREPLWRHGLDYDHGTGHGVGHFLSVHEHPQRLQKAASPAVIEAGMTLTNEPGYYLAGAYGMRVENLCEVVRDERSFLRLRELTLVPVDRQLIDPNLLDPIEHEWLNAYHERVRAEMAPLLADERALQWLVKATAPLS